MLRQPTPAPVAGWPLSVVIPKQRNAPGTCRRRLSHMARVRCARDRIRNRYHFVSTNRHGAHRQPSGRWVDSTQRSESAGDGLHVLGTTPGSTGRPAWTAGRRRDRLPSTARRCAGSGADKSPAGAASRQTTLALGRRRAAGFRPWSASMWARPRAPADAECSDAGGLCSGPCMSSSAIAEAAAASRGSAAVALPPADRSDGCGAHQRLRYGRAAAANACMRHASCWLDGSTPGARRETPSFSRSRRGEHRFAGSAENISDPGHSVSAREFATRAAGQTSKALTVMVHPGQTALVAAQLHLDRTTDLNHGSYWDPGRGGKRFPEACH